MHLEVISPRLRLWIVPSSHPATLDMIYGAAVVFGVLR